MTQMGISLKYMLIFLLLLGSAQAHEIQVSTQDGKTFVFDIDPDESLGQLQEKVTALVDGRSSQGFLIEVPSKRKGVFWRIQATKQGNDLGHIRDFSIPVTPEEQHYIHYIVTELANKNLISIGLEKKNLEDAGDRIDHIHPLRFLMTIFTEDELIAGIHNIRGKGWIWSKFVGGLKNSLTTEANYNNMKHEYIHHFAQAVNVDFALIEEAVQERRWDDFIDLLIIHVERKGDPDFFGDNC